MKRLLLFLWLRSRHSLVWTGYHRRLHQRGESLFGGRRAAQDRGLFNVGILTQASYNNDRNNKGQIVAKLSYSCHVTVICSAKNAEYVKMLGADEVIDYTTQPVIQTLLEMRKASPDPYDLLVDCVGGRDLIETYVSPLPRMLLLLNPAISHNSSTSQEHT